ncbi:hypothetical protein MJO10_33530, partial [Salmonella enterica subsp. enterica serovar Anatum]|nr:hypothetical protein [Salmonella enterica subsp. enterica serovar Anatum]
FIGKIRDYDGSRPSAIAKVQIDGELMLTELGLLGDEQAEKKIRLYRPAKRMPPDAEELWEIFVEEQI